VTGRRNVSAFEALAKNVDDYVARTKAA